jgi:hypothetical protein
MCRYQCGACVDTYRRRWFSGTILASLVLGSTGFWVRISAQTPITTGGDIRGGFVQGLVSPPATGPYIGLVRIISEAPRVCPNGCWYLLKKMGGWSFIT